MSTTNYTFKSEQLSHVAYRLIFVIAATWLCLSPAIVMILRDYDRAWTFLFIFLIGGLVNLVQLGVVFFMFLAYVMQAQEDKESGNGQGS